MFDGKRLGLTNRDLAAWTEDELFECSYQMCDILSFKNYLREFNHVLAKGYWTNAKNVTNEKT